MLSPEIFDGPEDMARALRVICDNLLPLLDWIEGLEDPAGRGRVSAALFTVLAYRAVKDGATSRADLADSVNAICDAIGAGLLDNVVPLRRGAAEP